MYETATWEAVLECDQAMPMDEAVVKNAAMLLHRVQVALSPVQLHADGPREPDVHVQDLVQTASRGRST